MAKRNSVDDVWRYIEIRGDDDCWLWKGSWGGRRTHLMPYFAANGSRWIAYRKVFELVTGQELSPEQFLCHSCDNGSAPIGCCNFRHLRIGTHQDNTNDKKERERHGLPHSVVRNIRRLLNKGYTQNNIAELYGVSRETVSAIRTGRTYSHVGEDYVDVNAQLLRRAANGG